MDRRRFLQGVGAVGLVWVGRAGRAAPVGGVLEPWRRGGLDIHHISTGRGNSVLAVLPDGTSLMIDAGAKAGGGKELAAARPSAERRPGEWIGRYAQRQLRAVSAERQQIDYFFLTHLHDDHMGGVTAASPVAASGEYRLTGVSDVAEVVPIRRILDRGYPDYGYPTKFTDPSAKNYIAFVKASVQKGVVAERVMVGWATQMRLTQAPGQFPQFEARTVAANGEFWESKHKRVVKLFPAVDALQREQYPTENACSAAVVLQYGAFRYYNGGDLTNDTDFGGRPWMDVETAVARSAGPVSVAALNHHGYYDADGPEFVRAMQARIYVLQSWHASHPDLATLNRLYSPVLQAGARDVLATSLTDAAELADARLSDKMLSQQGHVVVRVAPGGASYEVMVVDDGDETGTVKARFGPYQS